MKTEEQSSLQNEEFVSVSYIAPLIFIIPNDEKPIEFTLSEINSSTYNHSLLCRVVGEIEDNYVSTFNHFLICGDGAFAIPTTVQATSDSLVLLFNNVFCKLLLGGVEVESINPKDIVKGRKYGEHSIWPVNFGHSSSSQMHSRLRMRLANNMETILLTGAKSITIDELKVAYIVGNDILRKIPNISPYFLLSGITELRYKNWSSALSYLWIIAEQLTDFIWEDRFLNDINKHPNPDISGRKQTLRQDHRTYTSSVKQEVLYQIGALTSDIYTQLYRARKARNKLVHEGIMINQDDSVALYEATKNMLSSAINDWDIPLYKRTFSFIGLID